MGAPKKFRGHAKVCSRCAVVRSVNSYNKGKTVCAQCQYAQNKCLTIEERTRMVALKIIERNGWQFASEEAREACIERLSWDGSRRTQQKGEIERWEKTPPNKRG